METSEIIAEDSWLSLLSNEHVLNRRVQLRVLSVDSFKPPPAQIVTMLDVAIRGIRDSWNDVIVPGLD